MNYENILLSIEDGIAHLRLNRPAKRNAVNNGLLQDIEAALDGMGSDATVVVISGEGAHFSAGLDLSEHQVRTPFEVLQHSQWWHRVFHKVQFGGRPVVERGRLLTVDTDAYAPQVRDASKELLRRAGI